MKLKIVEHAYIRAKERFNWNEKTLLRMAQKALDIGFKHTQFKGAVKLYLRNLFLNNKSCNNIRIYGEVVYLFSGSRLVTLYRMPKEIIKQVDRCKTTPQPKTAFKKPTTQKTYGRSNLLNGWRHGSYIRRP